MRIDLNTKVSEYFGVKELSGAKYGLELEYENARMSRLDTEKTPLTRWKIDSDHSLRKGGVEFISRPTAMNVMDIAIDQAIAAIRSIGATPTPRCGLHVHVNMSDKTFREVFNLSVLYTLLEPVLFAEFADGRQENHFCVPTYSNTVLVENMYEDIQKLRRGITVTPPKPLKPSPKKIKMMYGFGPNEPIPNNLMQELLQAGPPGGGGVNAAPPGQEWSPSMISHPPLLKFCHVPKYAALNYSALRKFGTLEYRQHPSTSSKVQLLGWVKLIDRIHEYASTFNDPLDLIQLYDDDGLGALCSKVGLKSTKEIDQYDLEDAVDAATMMAGHVPVDWNELKWEIA